MTAGAPLPFLRAPFQLPFQGHFGFQPFRNLQTYTIRESVTKGVGRAQVAAANALALSYPCRSNLKKGKRRGREEGTEHFLSQYFPSVKILPFDASIFPSRSEEIEGRGCIIRANQHLVSDNILAVLTTCFVPLFSLLVPDETSFASSYSGTARVYLCHQFLVQFCSPFRHFVLWRVFPPRILTHVFVSLSL